MKLTHRGEVAIVLAFIAGFAFLCHVFGEGGF